MKFLLMLSVLGIFAVPTVQAQAVAATSIAAPNKTKEMMVVDAACGQCRLELPGKSCDLAIRLNGHSYFVDGTTIDSHGDAHAEDGLCKAIRKAEVQGEIVDNRFKASYFHLIPETVQAK